MVYCGGVEEAVVEKSVVVVMVMGMNVIRRSVASASRVFVFVVFFTFSPISYVILFHF